MPIDQILAQHERILRAVEALEQFVAHPRPVHVDGLASRRWTFTRDVLMHCSRMESTILAPMAGDVRPVAAARARVASDETAKFVSAFHGHVERWHGLPPAERWVEYRGAVERLVHMIRRLLDREAQEILPLLPIRPGGKPVPAPRERYAGMAWQVRSRIYDADLRPLE